MTSINKFQIKSKSDLEALEYFKVLIKNISLLKDKNRGCPWHKIQSHESLIKFLTEETYEFINAVYEKDANNICEELGDLLLQIMLHTEIGFEKKEFELKDVIRNLNMKIINRHPYIFKNKEKISLKKSQEIWNKIKSIELSDQGKQKTISSKIQSKIKRLPANNAAEKITEEVKKYGFKWDTNDQIFEKLNEEINELKEAIKTKKELDIKEEFGDIYFTLISISNFLKINPEEALHKANTKFLERFAIIEELVGHNINNQSSQNYKKLWQIAKRTIQKKKNIKK